MVKNVEAVTSYRELEADHKHSEMMILMPVFIGKAVTGM